MPRSREPVDLTCDSEPCSQPSRMAVRAVKKPDGEIHVQVRTDPARGAGWLPYCKKHGLEVTTSLVRAVVR